jgi:hypothetical protein
MSIIKFTGVHGRNVLSDALLDILYIVVFSSVSYPFIRQTKLFILKCTM